MKVWRIVVVLLLCLTLVGSVACNPFGGSSQEEASQQLVKVVRGDLTVSVSGAGNIAVANEVNLTFETTSGRVDKICVSVGDKVSQGEVLAELASLDTDALELALAQAKAAQTQAEATQAQAKVTRDESEYNLNQLKNVLHASYDQVKIAESQLEADELKLEAGELQVKTAEQAVAEAQKKLENETITAPFNGVVAGIGAEEGDIISAGSMVIHLIDPSAMELEVQVDEIDIPKIKLNQKAVITLDALPDVQLNGSISAISPVPAAESGVVLYDVTIALTVPGGTDLKVGMSATADIIVEKRSDVLLVPTQAIRQDRQGNPAVKVMVDEQIEERPVVTGLSVGLQTEIVEGVSQGEIVVVELETGAQPSSEPSGKSGIIPRMPGVHPGK